MLIVSCRKQSSTRQLKKPNPPHVSTSTAVLAEHAASQTGAAKCQIIIFLEGIRHQLALLAKAISAHWLSKYLKSPSPTHDNTMSLHGLLNCSPIFVHHHSPERPLTHTNCLLHAITTRVNAFPKFLMRTSSTQFSSKSGLRSTGSGITKEINFCYSKTPPIIQHLEDSSLISMLDAQNPKSWLSHVH